MPNIYLYTGEALPADIRLYDAETAAYLAGAQLTGIRAWRIVGDGEDDQWQIPLAAASGGGGGGFKAAWAFRSNILLNRRRIHD